MSTEEGVLLDSIGSTLSETYATLNADEATAQPEAEAAESVTQETEAERTERLRDEQGRFAKAQQEAAAEQGETQEQEQPPEQAVKAPGSWPAEMKEKFPALPPEVQSYILQRESDVSRTINNFSQKAKFADVVGQVLQPHEALIRSRGYEPINVINGLMNTYSALENGAPQQKALAVAQLINQFGVDLSLISEDGTAGNSAADPQLYARLSQLEQQLMQRQQQDEEAAQAQVQSVIAEFKRNAPHFDAVQVPMAALLEKGVAKDLQDAYDQACWATPEIRETLRREQEAKRREEAARIAEAAKKAGAVNVAKRGIQPPAKPLGSMEDTMRETLRNLNYS